MFKEIGSKRINEREIIDTVMSEAWPSSILQLPNRHKLTRALLEQLKIIEDKGTHRIELSSFPETRLMQIIIPADRDKGYENDIVLGRFCHNTIHTPSSTLSSNLSHSLSFSHSPLTPSLPLIPLLPLLTHPRSLPSPPLITFTHSSTPSRTLTPHLPPLHPPLLLTGTPLSLSLDPSRPPCRVAPS